MDSLSRLIERWHREQRTISKPREPGFEPEGATSLPVLEGGRGTWTEDELMVAEGGRREGCTE